MMKRTRPALWIPFLMVVWGFLCIMMGLVKNFAGLLATRILLGFAEGQSIHQFGVHPTSLTPCRWSFPRCYFLHHDVVCLIMAHAWYLDRF